MNEIQERWTAEAKRVLVGRTIVDAWYADAFGVGRKGLCLTLDNDVVLVVQQDDEGNGPGALGYGDEEEQGTLPVL